MRPCRIGTSSGRRPFSDSLINRSGSARLLDGFQKACELRGHWARNSSPFAKSSARESRDGNAVTFSSETCRGASAREVPVLLIMACPTYRYCNQRETCGDGRLLESDDRASLQVSE